jgi:hypothetical protein
MSMFEDNRYRWRETYFVLFHSADRPTLGAVEQTLSGLNDHYELRDLRADEDGLAESLTLLSPDDFAALDICYTCGPEVLEQGADLADEVGHALHRDGSQSLDERIRLCDARFDVLHFEEVPEQDDEDAEEMLDPSALLLVLEALAKITNGVAVDPQAGAPMSEEGEE